MTRYLTYYTENGQVKKITRGQKMQMKKNLHKANWPAFWELQKALNEWNYYYYTSLHNK